MLALASLVAGQAQTIISGGGNQITGPNFYLGTHTPSPSGLVLNYDDALTGGVVVKFHANQLGAWLWENGTGTASPTTWPSMKLDLSNNLILYNGTNEGARLDPTGGGKLTLGGSTGAILSASGVNFSTNGGSLTVGSMTNSTGAFNATSVMTFTSGGNITFTPGGSGYTIFNGNVGIRTTIPDKPLHVAYDSVSTPAIKIGSGTDAQGWYTFLGNDTGSATTSYVGNAYNNDGAAFQIRMKGTAAANARLTVLGNGNVGIGTSSIPQKLTVGGNIGKSGSWILGDSVWGGNWLEVHNSAWDGVSNANYGGVVGGHGYFYGGLQSGGYSGGEAAAGQLYVADRSMLIGGAGIGIGATAPGATLEVGGPLSGYPATSGASQPAGSARFGNSQTNGVLDLGVNSAGGGWLQYTNRTDLSQNYPLLLNPNGGNVGIGVITPLDRLHINPVRPIIMGYNGGSGVYGSHVGFNMTINTQSVPNKVTKLGGTSQNGGAITTVDYYGNYSLQTYNGGSEVASTINYAPQFVFSNAGNLGIGVATPNEPLEIAGTGRMFLGDGGGSARKGLLIDAVEDGTYVRLHAYNYGTLSSMNLIINPYGGGNVGIGTTNPGSYKLAVLGSIHATSVVVETGWSDYVFDKDYRLAPLSEVEAHIKAEKHLPGIPSAAEVAEKGVSLGDMQSKLLAKVEELTLHLIAQEKTLTAVQSENASLRQRLATLEAKQR